MTLGMSRWVLALEIRSNRLWKMIYIFCKTCSTFDYRRIHSQCASSHVTCISEISKNIHYKWAWVWQSGINWISADDLFGWIVVSYRWDAHQMLLLWILDNYIRRLCTLISSSSIELQMSNTMCFVNQIKPASVSAPSVNSHCPCIQKTFRLQWC